MRLKRGGVFGSLKDKARKELERLKEKAEKEGKRVENRLKKVRDDFKADLSELNAEKTALKLQEQQQAQAEAEKARKEEEQAEQRRKEAEQVRLICRAKDISDAFFLLVFFQKSYPDCTKQAAFKLIVIGGTESGYIHSCFPQPTSRHHIAHRWAVTGRLHVCTSFGRFPCQHFPIGLSSVYH